MPSGTMYAGIQVPAGAARGPAQYACLVCRWLSNFQSVLSFAGPDHGITEPDKANASKPLSSWYTEPD